MYQLNFKKNSNRYSEKNLFDNLEKVWNFKNEQPTTRDMQCFPSEITFGTYFNRFGSWKNALIEFVKYKNSGKISIKKNEYITKKRKNFNNSLRYDIMKRDNFKCCLCGKSPAKDSNVILEIDHILPITKGGDNNFDNLQTLCKDCNIGKLNKH